MNDEIEIWLEKRKWYKNYEYRLYISELII